MANTWNIYVTENVYKKADDGKFHKDTVKLDKIIGGLKDFRTECWPIIDEIKKEFLRWEGHWEGPLSRSEDWCIDTMFRHATENDKVRDDMFPDTIIVEIITTPYTLALKEN